METVDAGGVPLGGLRPAPGPFGVGARGILDPSARARGAIYRHRKPVRRPDPRFCERVAAVVVLLTPDEVAHLQPRYGDGLHDVETQPAEQARPNSWGQR